MLPVELKNYPHETGNKLKCFEPDLGYDAMKMSSFLAGNFVKASTFSSVIPRPPRIGKP